MLSGYFSFKEQASFNFIAAVTICSDFGAQENKTVGFPFPLLFFSLDSLEKTLMLGGMGVGEEGDDQG